MIKSKAEILEIIKARVGDDTSDETLTMIEDISDTLTDLEKKAAGDGKDWKAEAARIDAEWRQKYKERFFSPAPDEDPPEDPEPPRKYTYDELFTEKEEK